MATNIDETKPAEKPSLDTEHLLTIYREQFQHIRHLENADALSTAFIGLFTLGVFVLIHLPFMEQKPHDVLGLGTVAILLLGGLGIYGTTRRMAYRMRHLAIINRVGRVIGAVRVGVVPASLGGEVPRSLGQFWKGLILGYRGPVIVFYSALIWALAFSLPFELGYTTHAIVAGAIGLAIVAFSNLTSLLTSWARLRDEMLTLRQEMELGTSLEKSPAEQYCDLADSLICLRPPRLNEALRHYQEALALDPESHRAREGVDRLMSWKVQDYR